MIYSMDEVVPIRREQLRLEEVTKPAEEQRTCMAYGCTEQTTHAYDIYHLRSDWCLHHTKQVLQKDEVPPVTWWQAWRRRRKAVTQ